MLTLIFLTVMLTARLSLRTWSGIMVAGAAGAGADVGVRPARLPANRIIAFINPALDPASAWQPQQAMNARRLGPVLRQGLPAGRPRSARRSLPALWTDFPFAVWGEEWGFLGGVLLLAPTRS